MERASHISRYALLDVPIWDKNDPPDKAGAKYIWLSSSSKEMGTTSGSPVHFVGKFPGRALESKLLNLFLRKPPLFRPQMAPVGGRQGKHPKQL